jgi:hypothetical protein
MLLLLNAKVRNPMTGILVPCTSHFGLIIDDRTYSEISTVDTSSSEAVSSVERKPSLDESQQTGYRIIA